MLDTFVAAQLRTELPICTARPRLYHLRRQQGRQVIDVLAELGGVKVFAVEVKADAAPGRDEARHLRWLRNRLGDRFLGGALLQTGPRAWQLHERIIAAPICTLWAQGE